MEQRSLSNFNPHLSDSPFNLNLQQPSPSNSDLDIYLESDDEALSENMPGVTKTIQKSFDPKKKYHNIPNELRSKLIEAVEEKGEKIKHAAKKLNINYSSAKSICQVYKKEGRSDKKIFKRRGSHGKSGSDYTAYSPLFTQNYLPNPVVVPTKIDETEASNIYMSPTFPKVDEEPQDSLLLLRERLLAARANVLKSEDYEEKDLMKDAKNGSESFVDQANSYVQFKEDHSSPEKKNSNQNNQTYSILPQKDQSFMNDQKPKQIFVPNGNGSNFFMQGQPIYVFQPQAIGSMMMSPPQTFQFSAPNFSQNIMSTGPSQTININQPQAKNMNIQSGSTENTMIKQVPSMNTPNMTGLYLNNGNFMNQNNMNQQYQVYPMQQQTIFMPVLMNGYQNMQPARFIMPQNNNIQMGQMGQMGQMSPMNAFPQVIINDPSFFNMPSQNMNMNFRNFQPTMMQPYQNFGQSNEYNNSNDIKQNINDTYYQENSKELENFNENGSEKI